MSNFERIEKKSDVQDFKNPELHKLYTEMQELWLNGKNTDFLVKNYEIDTIWELDTKLNSFELKWDFNLSKKSEILSKIKEIRETKNKIDEEIKLWKTSLKKTTIGDREKLRLELWSTLNLMEFVEKEWQVNNYTFLEKYLPPKMVFDFKNPKKFHHQIGWFCLWSGNSIILCWKLLKDITIWIFNTFPDLFSMFKWTAVYERNI